MEWNAVRFLVNLPEENLKKFTLPGWEMASSSVISMDMLRVFVRAFVSQFNSFSIVRSLPMLCVSSVFVLSDRKKLRGRILLAGLTIVASSSLLLSGCGGGGSKQTTPAPTFTPTAGSYSTAQMVQVSDSNPNAALYCTTDGSMATTSSPQCTAPITVSQSETINAIAQVPGFNPSPVATAAYTINEPIAATPVIAPNGGTFASAQTVTITDATAGATIYYTLDGTMPTASSTAYSVSAPIIVSTTETINAIAVATGYANSAEATAAFTITLTAATPVISPNGGTFTSAQTVTISDATAGAAIYYTTNGTMPTTSSMRYIVGTTITVSATETISAIAVASGYNNSALATAAFTVNLTAAATPMISPNGGPFTSAQTVTISDATAGAAIYYTTNGSTPTTSSTPYGGAITVSSTETINAIAVATGYTNSAVATAAFTINLSATATPTFTPAAGAVVSGTTVTINDATVGAAIYYTTDGTMPTSSSTPYTTPIAVSSAETISAIAIASGDSNSAVGTAAYTLTVLPMISGTVASATLPVSGASVQLYAAGTSGYGAGATAVGSPVTTNASGAFTVSYSCPAAPGDQMYLVATGGTTSTTPSAASNTGVAMMTALGTCANIGTTTLASVTLNEVTTIASAYALSPFATVKSSGPGIVVGAPAPSATCTTSGPATCNYKGLVNSFLMVNNLVNIGTGTALSITPYYSGHPLGSGTQQAPTTPVPFLNSSTVPQTRINTLADILATCVEETGSGCSALFGAATPPASGSVAPADTLQTALDIAQNPLNNVATLFGLQAATPPYSPALSAANPAPTDFTLALTFTGAGLGTSSTTSPAADVVGTGMAIDANGNLFVTAAGAASGMLAEFNTFGEALTLPTTVSTGPSPVATYGGFLSNDLPNNVGGEFTGIAFDQTGNLWIPLGSGQSIDEVSTIPSLSLKSVSTKSISSGGGVAVDQSGNVWGANGSIFEITNGALSATYPISGSPQTDEPYPTFDSNGNLWFEDNNLNLYTYSTAGATPGTQLAKYTNALVGNLVADQSGNIYGCNNATNAGLEVYNISTSTMAPAANYSTPQGCWFAPPVAQDGLGNVYMEGLNNYPALIVQSSTGATLTGTSGYTGTSSSEAATLNVNDGSSAMAVDGSGNLWVLNYNISVDTNNALVEFVGIAAPVITPTSVALTDGELATRP
jgi:hypothetical protein